MSDIRQLVDLLQGQENKYKTYTNEPPTDSTCKMCFFLKYFFLKIIVLHVCACEMYNMCQGIKFYKSIWLASMFIFYLFVGGGGSCQDSG